MLFETTLSLLSLTKDLLTQVFQNTPSSNVSTDHQKKYRCINYIKQGVEVSLSLFLKSTAQEFYLEIFLDEYMNDTVLVSNEKKTKLPGSDEKSQNFFTKFPQIMTHVLKSKINISLRKATQMHYDKGNPDPP